MNVVHLGSGYRTLQAHLSSVLALPERAVKRGDVTAKSGAKVNAMGAYLNCEIRFWVKSVDPMRIIIGTKAIGPE